MSAERLDVLIVGAGLSGIGSACHLKAQCPNLSFVILESRNASGGTWDLFRYPGIRSDSDMYTLGYKFKPWQDGKSIAHGSTILDYIRDASTEYEIDAHIRYRQQVKRVSWSTEDACWTVTAVDPDSGEVSEYRAGFLQMCAGYYDYEKPYEPNLPDMSEFSGEVVHPQFWPKNIDYKDKRVVVIGSGATAVTLIPELARDTTHTTMLQRSPTYMVSMPDTDWIANFLRKVLPEKTAYAITRWKNFRFQHFFYGQARKSPEKVRGKILAMARKAIGPEIDFETHMTPTYMPWDQRLCLVPNSDFFKSIRARRASIATGLIDAFEENGIRLQSGERLEADIIVTATGLELQLLGGAEVFVDDEAIDLSECWSYKSMMFSGVPNLLSIFGYINASWTLKADLAAEYTCRLLTYMHDNSHDICVAELRDSDRDMEARPWITNFSSGYIQRQIDLLPRQGNKAPWINTQNYVQDLKDIGEAPIADGVLRFSRAGVISRPSFPESSAA